MTDWVVRRWARYGHERLYAETPGGTALGYLDIKTGRFHADDLTNLPLLERAIAEHQTAQQGVGVSTSQLRFDAVVDDAPAEAVDSGPPADLQPAQQAAVDLGAAQQPNADLQAGQQLAGEGAPALSALAHAVPDWEDLSRTRAGAAARERALAEREAAGKFRTGLARVLGVKTDERAWRIGADGEEAVAARLARLGPEWRVLHAVPVGLRGSDIDHVVIGPAGVFTVNAKHHPRASVWVGGDTVMVNGQRVPYVRNSRHEARRAARLLTEQAGFPVAVTGVIAVMSAHDSFTVKKQPEDGKVVIVQRRQIARYLLKLQPRLSPREVDAVFEIARRSTTWR